MKRIFTVGFSLAVVFMMAGVSLAETINHISSAKISREYYHIGGDRISLGVIRFNTDNWKDKNYIDKQVGLAPKMNFNWDDKWYFEKLPDSTNELLVLFWKNHDANVYGWLAIKNTPDSWYYTSNQENHSWLKIKNDQKVNAYWKGFGTRNTGDAGGSLSIDIKNPKNEGSWTSNHIWIGFGK